MSQTINPNQISAEGCILVRCPPQVFTVTSITLIGYGHIAPTGAVGQTVLILYCLLGIPLTLMFLANIGKVFAAAIRFGEKGDGLFSSKRIWNAWSLTSRLRQR